MKQIAPEPHPLYDLVKRLRYKAGWHFYLQDEDRGQGSQGLTLTIRVAGPDSYAPERNFTVIHFMIVPAAAYNQRSWCRWLLDQILLVEQHEACEFFRIIDRDDLEKNTAEQRPYAPNHGPGNNPYTIFDQGFIEDARTMFTGETVPPDKDERKKKE